MRQRLRNWLRSKRNRWIYIGIFLAIQVVLKPPDSWGDLLLLPLHLGLWGLFLHSLLFDGGPTTGTDPMQKLAEDYANAVARDENGAKPEGPAPSANSTNQP
ncbi:MAG: hypothetical protein SFV54_25710 [Bryobacteraceae bacterium]|nr:hypothetical protein [Bryobacteraceae bacterium]